MPGRASKIHLSWMEDPSTSLTVTWQTPGTGAPAAVQYRRLDDGEWQHAVATTRPSPGIGGTLSKVTLRGLSPDTVYEYQVSSDPGVQPAWSQIAYTQTAPPRGPADFIFTFIADTGLIGRPDGLATGTYQVLQEIRADDPLFILGGGDYAYSDRDVRFGTVGEAVEAWFEQMEGVLTRSPLMAQYGNHEVSLDERIEDWAPRLGQSQRANQWKDFSFDVGDAHFVGLLIAGREPRAEQLNWLDADLAAARERKMRWLILFHHEPIYAHGKSHPAKPIIRQKLVPILQKHRVDLDLSAHDQNYERTYPLIGDSEKPTVANQSPDRYRAGDGVLYVKVSPGGKLSNLGGSFSRFSSEQKDFIAVRHDKAHHYALITVKPEGTLTVRVYAIECDGSAKYEIDQFTIFQ